MSLIIRRTFTLVLLLLSFSAVTTHSPSDAQSTASCQISIGTWQTAASIPYYHIEGATAVVNGKLYVIAGFKDTNLNTSGRVDVYNPQTNIWESIANPRKPLPVNLSHAQAAVDGKFIWMAGGFLDKNPGKPTNKVWKYDTEQDKWFSGPNLPAARAGGGLALAGRELHYFGGTAADHDTAYANHWVLNLDNPGAGWQDAADLPNKRIHAAGAYVNNTVYAIGGQYRHDHNPIDQKFLHAYNVSNNTWSRKADLPLPRSHFEPGTMVYNNRIIIVGGRANQSGFGQLNRVTEYNPAKNVWTELRQLPVKLIAPNAAIINDKLIVTAGGTDWHTGQKKTYVATVALMDCSSSTQSTATPTAAATPGADSATAGAYSVYISVDPPNDSINGSTYSDGSFLITNNSQSNLKISQLKFDMRPAILPDLAFDPNGTAGDNVGKPFKANAGGPATGFSSASYQYAFDGGYAGLTANFTNFTPGKTFKFSIDIDPTSIHGSSQPGPSESGSISGLEMTGTLVTVVFNDGHQITTTLFRKGTTNDASETTVKSSLPPAPTISIVGISTTPATVSKASQKVHVTGKPGASVKLLLLDTALYLNGSGYHVSAYEANTVVKIKQYSATLNGSGVVDIPVTLTRTNSKAGYNYLMAVISSGGTSQTSNRVVLRYVP